jgi:hypothetical protein
VFSSKKQDICIKFIHPTFNTQHPTLKMASKPSIPKGTRDFSPLEVSKRNYIISIMRHHFEKYGYQPIETPF